MTQSLADMRREYSTHELHEADVSSDPFVQFGQWFDDALRAEVHDPNAMALATADANGRPSVRIVLLKGIDERGFVFYTNLESRKGRELRANPRASLCFWWDELARQVRVDGSVELVSPEEADVYFASRPLESRLSAWASEQSTPIESRTVLEHRMEKMRDCYADQDVPRPAYWGGYRVLPVAIEFWQGRMSRLHDRISYRLADGVWRLERLSP